MTTFLEPAVKGRRIELAPPLPARVYVTHDHGDHYTAHLDPSCDPHAVASHTRSIRRAQPTWCNRNACWPGLRCNICREPSRTRNECGDCSTTQVDLETRRDAVDGWDVDRGAA